MPNPRRSALSIVLASLILSMAPATVGLAAPQTAEVVKRWALLAIPATERNSQPVDGCGRAAHDLARWARPGVTYLTPAGLAFLLTDAWPIGRPANCRFAVGDPVIVPYQALKRFMRPGPLGDELRKLN